MTKGPWKNGGADCFDDSEGTVFTLLDSQGELIAVSAAGTGAEVDD